MNLLSELRLYLCNNWINKIPSHTIRLWYYRKIMGFQIGKDSSIFMNCIFDAAKGFKMGSNSVINSNCRLDTRGGIDIGDNVSISSEVIILTADHDIDSDNMEGRNKGVTINNYVWFGTRAMILPGITIGEGGIVAAGALVTKDVDFREVVGGVPAKVIRIRKGGFHYKANYRRMFQ